MYSYKTVKSMLLTPRKCACRPEKILGWRGPKRDFLCFLAPLEELGGSKNQANNSKSICEKAGFPMLCLDPFS